ncbi:MAG: hypothetical protein ACM3PP_02755 [Candidatus Saccharibacteria bacterium]
MRRILAAFIILIVLTVVGCYPSTEVSTGIAPSPKWDSFTNNVKIYRDSSVSQETRVDALLKANDDLEELLKLDETASLSDDLLKSKLHNEVIVTKKKIVINGQSGFMRIVRYDGLPEVCGTLERVWTYVQWNDGFTRCQRLIDQGGEMATDFIYKPNPKSPSLILVGYTTEYSPRPVFASAWQLKDSRWVPISAFDQGIVSKSPWKISYADNEMIIENNDDQLFVETDEGNSGFKVYSQNDSKTRLQFEVAGSQILLKQNIK